MITMFLYVSYELTCVLKALVFKSQNSRERQLGWESWWSRPIWPTLAEVWCGLERRAEAAELARGGLAKHTNSLPLCRKQGMINDSSVTGPRTSRYGLACAIYTNLIYLLQRPGCIMKFCLEVSVSKQEYTPKFSKRGGDL